MKGKKADILKKLLQKTELDKAPDSFTASVMEEIVSQNEVVVNPALQMLLKRNGVEKPSLNFTDDVMTQVVLEASSAYQPIISKKAWGRISVAIVLFVLVLAFTGRNQTSPGGLSPYFINTGNAISKFFSNLDSLPSLFMITFFSMGVLLVMDYVLRDRGRSTATKS
jgi:hypothetical protein